MILVQIITASFVMQVASAFPFIQFNQVAPQLQTLQPKDFFHFISEPPVVFGLSGSDLVNNGLMSSRVIPTREFTRPVIFFKEGVPTANNLGAFPLRPVFVDQDEVMFPTNLNLGYSSEAIFSPATKTPAAIYFPNPGPTWTSNVPSIKPISSVSASGGSGTVIPPPANNVAAALQSVQSGSQAHVQVPCLLHIPNPVPISVTPGASQITATNPPPSQPQVKPPPPTLVLPAQPPAPIPPSYIDHSTPTIAILRPPSLSESIVDPSVPLQPGVAPNAPIPQKLEDSDNADKPSPEIGQTKTTRSPEVDTDIPHDHESLSLPGLARNGLPFMYALLPPSTFITTQGAATVSSSSMNSRIPSSSDNSRPQRGKNPYFNVNKRKHFEYYEYF